MRVLVLNTGRCGSTTFAEACRHLTNYTAGHETNARKIGPERLDYPDWHIEADNRLAWFLGDLGRRYPDAFYVHLTRDPDAVAASFLRRWDQGRANIVRAFAHGIVMRGNPYNEANRRNLCRMYVDTVTANIEAFLAGRDHTQVRLETIEDDFLLFLDRIGAEGDLGKASAEWATRTTPARRSRRPAPATRSADPAAAPAESGRNEREAQP